MKLILLFSLILLTLFTSCGKYEEGPNFSLRTKKNRLRSDWKLNKLYINGYIQNDIGFRLLLKDNNKFYYGYSLKSLPLSSTDYDFHADSLGMWELTKNKEHLRLRHQEIDTDQEYKMVDWKILRLEKTDLVLSREDNDDLIRMELVRQGDSDLFKKIRTN